MQIKIYHNYININFKLKKRYKLKIYNDRKKKI